LFILQLAFAQETAVPESISKSLGLFVFPGENQSSDTQTTDESACYKWALEQTGYNPINPTKVDAEKVDTSPDGSAIVGSAKGAAAGAAIGAIAGDAGKGAAIGAVAGGLAGRRSKVVHDQMEQQQNVQAATAQEQKMMDDFKKAFTACMEAKGYTIK
jgi:outer membrane lipoprotein SlyB